MRLTQLFIGTAFLVSGSISTYSFAESIASCVADGGTDFEQALSVQECEVAQQQEKMAEWDKQAEARKQSIEDLNSQIQSAPQDQKAVLQSQLIDLQNKYNSDYSALQEENRQQIQKGKELTEQFNHLPPAEQRLAQLRMNKQMIQQQIITTKDLESKQSTVGVDTPAPQSTETATVNAVPEEAALQAPVETEKPNDTLWGSIKALFGM